MSEEMGVQAVRGLHKAKETSVGTPRGSRREDLGGQSNLMVWILRGRNWG